MSTLVRINRIEDGIIHYSEVTACGRVMIKDYMTKEQFNRALNMKDYGFTLTGGTKAQTIMAVEFVSGAKVIDYDYCPYLGYKMQCTLDSGVHIQAETKHGLIQDAA